jgi:L-glutamine-phosphate cytidylyltransferase
LKAILLAAGRGSRLKGLTEATPKGLVELAGIPLLEWQVSALNAAGIDDITVVTGYRRESIEALGYKTRHNPHWASTNMVSSFLCAAELVTEKTIIGYSDIVYGTNVLDALLTCEAALGVVYDRDWLELWSARNENPLDDAESFRIGDDGSILDIGGKVSDVEQIQGQYMGLLQFSPESIGWVRDFMDRDKIDPAKLDMTSLLNGLIAAGHKLQGVGINGNWCEIDTQEDLVVAEQWLKDRRIRLPGFSKEVDAQ